MCKHMRISYNACIGLDKLLSNTRTLLFFFFGQTIVQREKKIYHQLLSQIIDYNRNSIISKNKYE